MSIKNTNLVAGMSIGGGKKENFYFCILEYFENEDRWFLSSLKDVKEESNLSKDDVITEWVDNSDLQYLIVDFPLTKPPCETCDLECPGISSCHHPVVTEIKGQISGLIEEDKKLVEENPKRYEQERNYDDEVHYSKCVLDKETTHHLLSKSFKRKLKRGFVPYWNRPIDFWVWKNYYDQLLKTFDISYDSFGNVSIMLLYKFHYLLRHLPQELKMFESNVNIILLELYRSGIVTKKSLIEIQDINVNTLSRLKITKEIETKLGIFIYEKDLDTICKNPKAFDSFLLVVAGQFLIKGKTKKIPGFGSKDNSKFLVPEFS
jgi:hypothetical protein